MVLGLVLGLGLGMGLVVVGGGWMSWVCLGGTEVLETLLDAPDLAPDTAFLVIFVPDSNVAWVAVASELALARRQEAKRKSHVRGTMIYDVRVTCDCCSLHHDGAATDRV